MATIQTLNHNNGVLTIEDGADRHAAGLRHPHPTEGGVQRDDDEIGMEA
jgi:hypothetical protein